MAFLRNCAELCQARKVEFRDDGLPQGVQRLLRLARAVTEREDMHRATVTRHFVLSPISTNEPAPVATEHLSVGIGFVKMPTYLLRNSIAIRNGANEIEYLEDARWAERLDQCFQRTLAANPSRLLRSDSIYLTDFGRDKVMVSVFINVEHFDVDTGGRGTLTAQWRIASPNSDQPLRSGHTRLVRTGATPRRNPNVIARTLSDLAAEFSRELAHPIRESARTSTPELARERTPSLKLGGKPSLAPLSDEKRER